MSKNNSGRELKKGHNRLLMEPGLTQHTELCSKLNGGNQRLLLGPWWLFTWATGTSSMWPTAARSAATLLQPGSRLGKCVLDRSCNLTDKSPDLKYILNMLHLSLMCLILIRLDEKTSVLLLFSLFSQDEVNNWNVLFFGTGLKENNKIIIIIILKVHFINREPWFHLYLYQSFLLKACMLVAKTGTAITFKTLLSVVREHA